MNKKGLYTKVKGLIKYFIYKDFRDRCTRMKSYGEVNADKRFYILRADSPYYGILTVYLGILNEIEWAVENGYIPMVDAKNNFLPLCQDEDKAYKENAWEYYFEQPVRGFSLEEVYQSKYVRLGWKNLSFPDGERWMKKILTQEEIMRWNPIVKKYMDFKPQIWESAHKFYSENKMSRHKVLGVVMRASFYRGELLKLKLFDGHPRQKSLQDCLDMVEKYKKEMECEYIFVSVEDREWAQTFKKKYGANCLLLERPLLHLFENGKVIERTEEIWKERKGVAIREYTEKYLVECGILSMCNSLLSYMGSSAGIVAQLHNGGAYENVKIYSEGTIGEI